MRNEAIAKLDGLVGTWSLTLTNSWFLDSLDVRLQGRATFEWLGDAFIVWTWAIDNAPVGPDGPTEMVIGYSDARGEYKVLGHDARGVSRVFDMTWGDGSWILHREDPDFHQRIVASVDVDRIDASAEASEDAGTTWRKDFDLIFERQAMP